MKLLETTSLGYLIKLYKVVRSGDDTHTQDITLPPPSSNLEYRIGSFNTHTHTYTHTHLHTFIKVKGVGKNEGIKVRGGIRLGTV